MKNFFLLLLVALVMVSCFDDDDSNITLTRYGVVSLSDDVLGYNIVIDGGWIAVPSSSDVDYTPKDSDRIKIYFEIMGGVSDNPLDVKVLDYFIMPTYDLITYDTLAVDTLGCDPVAVSSIGVSQNCNYLSIFYSYNMGYNYKVHSFNLVYYPDSVGDNGEVFLKFQHNAHADLEEVGTSDYKSFDMSSIPPFANVEDSVPYIININAGYYASGVTTLKGYFYNKKYLIQ